MHENYNPKTYENDIAILKLSRPLEFNDNVQPVALWTKWTITEEEVLSCYVSGWGRTSHGGSTSNHLMFVKLPLISWAICKQSYGRWSDGRQKIQPSSMICAGYPGIGGKDSCQGKSDILLDQVTKTPLYLLKYSVFDFFVQVIQ